MRKRFFCYIFIAIILGIQIGIEVPFAMAIALVCLILSLALFKIRLAAIMALVISAFIVITVGMYPIAEKSYENVTITGKVTSVIEEDNQTWLILEDCDHEELGRFKVSVYLLNYEQSKFSIKEGNTVEVTGKAEPNSNRKVYFYEPARIKEDSYYIETDKYNLINDDVDKNYFFRILRNKTRHTIFLNAFDDDSAGVIYAMVSGEKGYIYDHVEDIFSRCGTSHLLAVSGLHVSIILGVLLFLLKWLRTKKLSFILLFLFLIFYGCFAGGTSSVIRACIMALVAQLSIVYGQRYDSLNSLCFAGCIILTIEPLRLFDVGFILSFSACFGIVWISKKFIKRPKIVRGMVNSLLVTIGATVATLPVQLYFFGTVSAVSVIANMLLVPIASLVLALTFIFLIPAFLWAPAGVLLKVPGAMMAYMIKIASWLGNVPFIEFKIFPLFIMLLLFAGLVFFSRFVHLRKRYVVGAMLIILPIVWIGTAVFHNNNVKIGVINHENTDGVVIIEDGKNYVVGIEGEYYYLQRNYISKCMNEIDVLILTDKEDVDNFKNTILGIKYNNLYVTPNIEIDDDLMKAGAKELNVLKGESGTFRFDSALYYICGDEKINLNRVRKGESSLTYIRS